MNQLKDMLTNNETIDVNMKESVYGGTALHYAASSVDMMLGSKDGSDNDDGKDISRLPVSQERRDAISQRFDPAALGC